mgnify:CR=1 FL=1
MSEYNDPLPRQILSGAQMLFVAFGALVLMPLITGMDPNVALFTAGLGTLIFHIITGGQVPVFLASSFAFIAPILAAKGEFGLPAVMGGVIAAYRPVRLEIKGWTFLFRHPRSMDKDTSCAFSSGPKSRLIMEQPSIPSRPCLLEVARLMKAPPVSTDCPSVTMT